MILCLKESLNLMRKKRDSVEHKDVQSINGNESTDSGSVSDDISSVRSGSKRFRNNLINSTRKRKSAVSHCNYYLLL